MNRFYPLIGKHPASLVVMQAISKAAQTDEPILITGETGTGKELIANAIQQQSWRRNEAYIKINCAALSSIYIQSVFCDGNESQFAALKKPTRGLFDELCGGTLLLDEIEFLPINIQVKMLQLIEQGDYCSHSDRQTRSTGVRLLMATNANLLQLVKKGMFLEGLFVRLSASQIHAPALRERHTDIPLLIGYYLGQMSKHYAAPCPNLARETLDTLIGYSWPGNIRELRNLCENLVVRRIPGSVLPVQLPLA